MNVREFLVLIMVRSGNYVKIEISPCSVSINVSYVGLLLKFGDRRCTYVWFHEINLPLYLRR